jgi:hypothetical protein
VIVSFCRFRQRNEPKISLYRYRITDGEEDIMVDPEWHTSQLISFAYGRMWLENCSLPLEIRWRYFVVIDVKYVN